MLNALGPLPPLPCPAAGPGLGPLHSPLRRRWPFPCGTTARRAMWAGSGRVSSAGSGGGWRGPNALLARERFSFGRFRMGTRAMWHSTLWCISGTSTLWSCRVSISAGSLAHGRFGTQAIWRHSISAELRFWRALVCGHTILGMLGPQFGMHPR